MEKTVSPSSSRSSSISQTTRAPDFRTHTHSVYWAFLLHRVSGIALCIFLPLHFYVLGTALQSAAALQTHLSWTDHILFKFAEWGLVFLLTLHFLGGMRLLLIEFTPWSGLRKTGFALAIAMAFMTACIFGLALIR